MKCWRIISCVTDGVRKEKERLTAARFLHSYSLIDLCVNYYDSVQSLDFLNLLFPDSCVYIIEKTESE